MVLEVQDHKICKVIRLGCLCRRMVFVICMLSGSYEEQRKGMCSSRPVITSEWMCMKNHYIQEQRLIVRECAYMWLFMLFINCGRCSIANSGVARDCRVFTSSH
jgi:hypothetical protein